MCTAHFCGWEQALWYATLNWRLKMEMFLIQNIHVCFMTCEYPAWEWESSVEDVELVEMLDVEHFLAGPCHSFSNFNQRGSIYIQLWRLLLNPVLLPLDNFSVKIKQSERIGQPFQSQVWAKPAVKSKSRQTDFIYFSRLKVLSKLCCHYHYHRLVVVMKVNIFEALPPATLHASI